MSKDGVCGRPGRAVSHRVMGCIVAFGLAAAGGAAADETWGRRADLVEPNSEMAVVELDRKIYVIGGYPSTRVSVAAVQVYDADADTWSLTTPYPTPINHAVAAAVGGRIYVIGGQTNAGGRNEPSRYVATVHAYDPSAKSWTRRTDMPTARSGMAVAVLDDRIYVAGGRPPRGHDFAVYDPKADRWETLPDMPTQRNHLIGGTIDGKIYIFGGRFGGGFMSEPTAAVEAYDPQARSWAAKRPLPAPRGGINGVLALGCFHTFGGENPNAGPNGVYPQHEVYDPMTDSWHKMPNMPLPVHGVTGAVFLDGWIHLPGGGTHMGGSSGQTVHQVVRPTMRCG